MKLILLSIKAVLVGILGVICCVEPTVSHKCSKHSDALQNLKLAFAGGLAGGVTNALLFPLDTIKTIRQSNPTIASTSLAIQRVKSLGLGYLYSGFVPSVFGSIPSSALYFGGYESSKKFLKPLFNGRIPRVYIHTISAALGNVLSSLIFVPKEAIKQQIQVLKTGTLTISKSVQPNLSMLNVIELIYSQKGLKGFYPNFSATLARNIPGAVVSCNVYSDEFI